MFQRILLAYDGSPDGREALAQARNLASMYHATVRLVSIVDYAKDLMVMDGMTFVPDNFKTKTSVDAGLKGLTSIGCEATEEVRYGNPAAEIVLAAKEMKADLIVIGHRDQGTLSRWLNGSVGETILHSPPCSVLVAVNSQQMKDNVTSLRSAS